MNESFFGGPSRIETDPGRALEKATEVWARGYVNRVIKQRSFAQMIQEGSINAAVDLLNANIREGALRDQIYRRFADAERLGLGDAWEVLQKVCQTLNVTVDASPRDQYQACLAFIQQRR